MSNGKGDTTRPPSVPRDTFAANWDRTFRKAYDTWKPYETSALHDRLGSIECERLAINDVLRERINEAKASFPDSPDAAQP